MNGSLIGLRMVYTAYIDYHHFRQLFDRLSQNSHGSWYHGTGIFLECCSTNIFARILMMFPECILDPTDKIIRKL